MLTYRNKKNTTAVNNQGADLLPESKFYIRNIILVKYSIFFEHNLSSKDRSIIDKNIYNNDHSFGDQNFH
ncbi:hypothetical protein BpHYR1_015088 [Brachionus plicatilis]|uniref:Uncharacterized protein n=1 Tax=Brachionus plicatilis TaxID=10195 RepID=A0A3M7QBX9_BRAPC|nr:hypothetical protein BpHYR1_015088 [Brachionus plicatilis]